MADDSKEIIDAELQKELQKYAEEVATRYKTSLLSNFGSGSVLANSVTPFTSKNEDGTYSSGITVASYWKYVEYGRKPGKFPPRTNIYNWIVSKNIIPQPYQLPSGKTVTPTNDQLTFLISRKIATKGTEGKYLLKAITDTLIDELKKAVTESLKKYIKNEIKIDSLVM